MMVIVKSYRSPLLVVSDGHTLNKLSCFCMVFAAVDMCTYLMCIVQLGVCNEAVQFCITRQLIHSSPCKGACEGELHLFITHIKLHSTHCLIMYQPQGNNMQEQSQLFDM